MIPLSLTLRGLYSYQTEQTIDFTKLNEHHLFGIFGAVGSGKSTILEAITYALYGETDRLNRNDSRDHNMKNLRSDDIYIRFQFLAGEKLQREYCFEVEHRGRKKSSKFTRTQKVKQNGKWQVQEIAAEDIIGLSYPNFRRTIIIPQGRFQEFLQLGDADRTTMMKDIFGLARFDLYGKVKNQITKAEVQLAGINGQLLQLGELSSEGISHRREEVERGNAALAEFAKEMEQREAQLQKLAELKKIFSEIESTAARLHRLKEQSAWFEERKQRLADYQHCLSEFRTPLDRLDENERQQQEYETQRADRLQQKSEQFGLLENCDKQYAEAKSAFEQRDEWKQRATELQQLLRIRELEAQKIHSEKEMAAVSEKLQAIANETETLEKQRHSTRQHIAEVRQTLEQTKQLHDIEHWFIKKNQIVEALEKSRDQLRQIHGQLADIEREKAESLADIDLEFWEATLKIGLSLADLLTVAEDDIQGIREEIQARSQQIAHLQVQAKLEDFAGDLQPGTPCPLCGATEHPQPMNIANISAALAFEKKQLAELEAQANTLSQYRLHWQRLLDRRKDRQLLRERYEAEVADAEKRLNAHLAAFEWQDFSPDNDRQLSEAKQLAERNRQTLNNLDKQRDELDEQLAALRNSAEALHKNEAQLRQTTAAVAGELKSLSGKFEFIRPGDYAGMDAAAIDAESRRMVEKYENSSKLFRDLAQKREALQQQLAKLEGEIGSIESALKNLAKEHDTLTKNLTKAIDKSDFGSIEKIREILATSIDITAEQTEISAFEKEMHTLETRLEQLETEVQGQSYNADAHREQQFRKEELQQKIDRQRNLIAMLEKDIADMQQRLEQQQQLTREAEALGERLENLNTLKKMFTGKGFVNYVSRIYLQHLCRSANARFRQLTRQQLALEMEGDKFVVRDYLHGGELRSVKTLSGGQTFQASLCLALALADHVQKLSAAEQNFFFLDEGFGTLDKASLQLVFDTLKALRRENRIVGVISHVEEMQQEMDVFLKIVNDPESGSKIIPSWEMK